MDELQQEFIKIINIEFMYGVEEPWCNNQGVAILPYVIKDNEYYYLLLNNENNPLFKEKQISNYSTITGGLENLDPVKTVILEMLEETGINITNKQNNFFEEKKFSGKFSDKSKKARLLNYGENINNIINISECINEKVKIHYLGKHYANKSSTKLWYFFTIDLTKLNLDLTVTYKGKGDETEAEKEISARFVSSKQLNKSNDALSLATYGKFKKLKKEAKELEKEEIENFVEKYLAEYQNLSDNEDWTYLIPQSKWNKFNNGLNNKLKKLDESKLISSELIEKLKKEVKEYADANIINKSANRKNEPYELGNIQYFDSFIQNTVNDSEKPSTSGYKPKSPQM